MNRQLGTWPRDGLEHVPTCPVCGEAKRDELVNDMVDDAFGAAPGKWGMWRCRSCRSAYLDPRPDPATIALAYANYYTHEAPPPSLAERAHNTMRDRLAALARSLILPQASATYVNRLSLPKHVVRPELLDIGCGNGVFLARAQQAGWKVSGCDFDPAALAAAAGQDRDLRLGGAETFADRPGCFDAVTLSHVIEHVHDPRQLVQQCFALLKPGGTLFIDTPNADAAGLSVYGRHWRGLEAPRHLVLFTWASLERLLAETGLVAIARRPEVSVLPSVWLASEKLRRGLPLDVRGIRLPVSDLGRMIAQRLFGRKKNSEFVTISAKRPLRL